MEEEKTHNFIAYIQNRADSENPFGIEKKIIVIDQQEIKEVMEDEGYLEQEAISLLLQDISDEYSQGFMTVVFEKI